MDRSRNALVVASLLVLSLASTLCAQERASTSKQAPTIDELLLFFPTKHPDGKWEPDGLTFEDAWIDSEDGTKIHGWYCPAKKPRAVVLYLHGNAGNLSHRAALLRRLQNKLQLTTLIIDYRGYGRSDGIPSTAGLADDCRAARKFLAQKAQVKEAEIILMGRSLGGAYAVDLASTIPPKAIVLESTFSSLRDMANHHYPALAWLVAPGKLNSTKRLASIKSPLLQSHGDSDRTIPIQYAHKLHRTAAGPKRFLTIPGGTHNSPQPANYYRELQRFIASLPK